MSELVWNAYYHSINKREIRVFNIFEHSRFKEEVLKNLRRCKEKKAFAEELQKSLSYYFRWKCEWEIIISAWCGCPDTQDIKVDVYTQVANNWDIFVDYVWNSKRKPKE